MLVCGLCKKEYKSLHIHIVHTHKISVSEYKNHFPNAVMICQETRKKIGQKNAVSLKGNPKVSGMRGKHHSPDSCLRMSKSRNGKSAIKTGIGLQKYFSDPENRKKVSEKQLELHRTQHEKFDNFNTVKRMISEGIMTHPKGMLGKKQSLEQREKRSIQRKKYLQEHPETIELIRKASKEHWQNPEYAKKILCYRGMNKTEGILFDILEKNWPGHWKFVGDGQVKIGRKYPDFISTDSKQIIEMFGDYWHKGDDPNIKINHYAKYGYRCLVVWSREFKDTDLINRISNFMGGN